MVDEGNSPPLTGHPTGRSRPLLTLIAIIGVMTCLATGCGAAKSTATSAPTDSAAADGGTPVDGGDMVIGIANETKSWNPALATWADSGAMVGSSVLEPLATQGEDKGAKPFLADSWIANDTFTEWTIKLHPGVRYSDGEDFNAASVKKSLDFTVTGPLASLVAKGLLDQIDVVDNLTVKAKFLQPWASFPASFMQGPYSYQMAPAMIDAADHGASHPIGTGPFVFTSWTPDSSFKASKNPNYWRPGLPHLDSIEFRVIPDETARSDALKTGDVNMITTTTAATANGLANSYSVTKDWTSETAFVQTNTAATVGGKPNPLSDLHARLALAYATDPAVVAALIGDGVEIPTSMWSPPSPWAQPKDQNGWLSPDVDRAKQEVATYLQDTGASSLDITLSGTPGIDTAKVLQLLASQWGGAGINVTIDSLDQASTVTKVALGNYEAVLFRNYGAADPDGSWAFFSSTTNNDVGKLSVNFTHYSTPAMDKDLSIGRSSGYPDIRRDAYGDLVKQVNAAATHIWLYNTPYSYVADPTVHGLSTAAALGFGNYMPKTWESELWRTH